MLSMKLHFKENIVRQRMIFFLLEKKNKGRGAEIKTDLLD